MPKALRSPRLLPALSDTVFHTDHSDRSSYQTFPRIPGTGIPRHSDRKYSCCSVPFPPDLRTALSQCRSPDKLWKAPAPAQPSRTQTFLPIHCRFLAPHCSSLPFRYLHLLPAGKATHLPEALRKDREALPPPLSAHLRLLLPPKPPEGSLPASTDTPFPQSVRQTVSSSPG